MAEAGRTFVVVGAGIAGLTLALSLAKFGATVIVLERTSSLQEFGAGLQISPNARRILDRLGTSRYISPRAMLPEALDIYPFWNRQPVASLQFGETATRRFGTPYAVMHRADLALSLLQACKRFANIDILFGVRGYDIAQYSAGVTVTIDEADGKSRTVRPFALIGADGVNSETRTEILGGPKAKYSGYVAWRTLLPMGSLDGVLAMDRTSLLCGPGFHAVVYPLPHRKQINVAAFTRVPREIAFTKTEPGEMRISQIARTSAQFDAILKAAGPTWTKWPMSAVYTPTWYKGSVGLIGDAAHAMLPFQAQGAAMAIEDAAILAPFLVTERKADAAFSRYQSLRLGRTSRVAQVSKRNGTIFHMPWPLSIARDMALKAGGQTLHLQKLAWIYDYDPAPDPPSANR